MKVVFVGPSLPAIGEISLPADIEVRGPAAQGDLLRATLEGACVIGLVDGTFGTNGSTWHKEILHALSLGVRVIGAASMGALRAAECATFGMIGVGEIYERYAAGELTDDDAVALIHAPERLGSIALSEPLVNVDATCRVLLGMALISDHENAALLQAARGQFFQERTYASVANAAAGIAVERKQELELLLVSHQHNVKQADALALMAAVVSAPDVRAAAPSWTFVETTAFKSIYDRIAGAS